MSEDIFQSLWVGKSLSMMERLSIESFMHFGYEYHLYCYGEVENVPQGVEVRDANEILPAEEVFYYKHGFGKGSPACFSDMFRYKMLLEKGNWWVDTDMVCVRPFDFKQEHVIGYQRDSNGESLNGAVMKMPAGSRMAEYCYNACLQVDRNTTRWGEIGPELVQQAKDSLAMHECTVSPATFYPIDYWKIEEFFEDDPLPPETYGVHLWHAVWKDRRIDPAGLFPPNCMYERFRRQFLPGYSSPALSDKQCEKIERELSRRNAPKKKNLFKRMLRWKQAA